MALVEQIVLGETIEEVAARVLRERLDEAKSASDAAGVLIEAVVTASPVTVSAALEACERFAATDDDLPSLARACHILSTMVSMGTSRKHVAHGDDALPALCRKIFDRAVLRVSDACQCDDEAVVPIKGALGTLHHVALGQPIVDKNAWLTAARGLVDSWAINPSAAGYAAGLLNLAQVLVDDEIAARRRPARLRHDGARARRLVPGRVLRGQRQRRS